MNNWDRISSEISVGHRFLERAGLRVLPGSLVKRQPPEPDLRCTLVTGEELALELVEVCNSRNARFMFSAKPIHEALMAAYAALPQIVYDRFAARYACRPLSFYFRSDASRALIQSNLPALLIELVDAPVFEEEFRDFSPQVARVVERVCFRGKLIDHTRVNFNIGGCFDPSVPTKALEANLAKRYITNCPIDLVAHFGAMAWSEEGDYREHIMAILEQFGLGPFRRFWLLDWEGVALVYPELQNSDQVQVT